MADKHKLPIRARRSYNVPTTWNQGDTIEWDVTVPDYPASDGWTLTYEAKSSTSDLATITASANGDDYTVTVSASTSSGYSVGDYHYVAYVTKSAERFTVDSGRVSILKNFETSGNYDDRSHAETVLDAINAVLESRATKDQESYSIAGRSLNRTPIADLIMLRDKYKTEVVRDERADRIRRGLGHEGRILTRFTPLS